MTTERVTVTGGSGKLGRYLVSELLDFGYDVVNFDLREPPAEYESFYDGSEYHEGSVLDSVDCKRAVDGADAVVHLAALNVLADERPERVFNANVSAAYNVFEAVWEGSPNRIVFASSDAVYGFNFRRSVDDAYVPAYLPIDEDHPCTPVDHYGLSKLLTEEVGEHFSRKDVDDELTIVGIRMSHLVIPEEDSPAGIDEYRTSIRKHGVMMDSFELDCNDDLAFYRLFSYNDARDAARGFRLALEAEHLHGTFEVVGIGHAGDNPSRYDTAELIERYGYESVTRTRPLVGREPLLDFERARQLLGFDPQHNWWDRYGSDAIAGNGSTGEEG